MKDDYATYYTEDGNSLYVRHPTIKVLLSDSVRTTYRFTNGPYCKVHKDMLLYNFKICELEHAKYFIYPKKNNETGENETRYAVSKPKIVGMILGWYIKVEDN